MENVKRDAVADAYNINMSITAYDVLKSKCAHVHFYIKQLGCNGFSYVLEPINESLVDGVVCTYKHESDSILQMSISHSSLLFLLGVRIHYVSSDLYSGFVFENPNVKKMCHCGQSVRFKKSCSSSNDILG